VIPADGPREPTNSGGELSAIGDRRRGSGWMPIADAFDIWCRWGRRFAWPRSEGRDALPARRASLGCGQAIGLPRAS